MEITDEMMAEAVADMNEAMLRSLPKPEECHHEFSTRFERKMKRAIYRAEHPIQYRVMQRVASIVLVLFIGFVSILAISPTVRAAVFGWIREQYEAFTTYFFEGTIEVEGSSRTFSLGTIPEGYEYITTNETPSFTTEIYANGDNALYFTFTKDPSESAVNVMHNNYTLQSATIGGVTYDLFLSNDAGDANGISWVDTYTNTYFHISAFLNAEELIKLAQEVICENN